MSSYFEGFTDADSANEDCISIKRIYIDLLGNLTEAAVFTQIMFWHGRDKRGKTRLRVTRDDELWIAKSYEEWAEECHITARAARDAIRRITESGLIIRKNYHFRGKKTLHIRVDKAQFEKQMSALSDTKCQIQEGIRHDMSDTNDTKRQIPPPLSDTKCQLFDLTDTTSTNTTKHVVQRFFVPALLDAVTKQTTKITPLDPDPATYDEWMIFLNREFKIGTTARTAGFIYNMFKNRAAQKGYKEFNIAPLAELSEVQLWVAYEKRNAKDGKFLIRKPETINAKFLYWREKRQAVDDEKQYRAELESA